MKTAIISDIHGNNPALQAVLADAAAQGADRLIFAGDYIFDMPDSNEVGRQLMELENAHIIAGNKEGYLAPLGQEDQSLWTSRQMGALHQTYRELQPQIKTFLSALPESLTVPLEAGGQIFVIHYPQTTPGLPPVLHSASDFRRRMWAKPFSHEEYLAAFQRALEEPVSQAAFRGRGASVVIYGHTHLQGYGYCGDTLVINPGSCGQPLDFDSRAPYTILVEEEGRLQVVERRIAYDIKAAIRAARESTVCQAGKIWCSLCFLAMQTGCNYFGFFFDIARRIADRKGEDGQFFTNETWEEAYADFLQWAEGRPERKYL